MRHGKGAFFCTYFFLTTAPVPLRIISLSSVTTPSIQCVFYVSTSTTFYVPPSTLHSNPLSRASLCFDACNEMICRGHHVEHLSEYHLWSRPMRASTRAWPPLTPPWRFHGCSSVCFHSVRTAVIDGYTISVIQAKGSGMTLCVVVTIRQHPHDHVHGWTLIGLQRILTSARKDCPTCPDESLANQDG